MLTTTPAGDAHTFRELDIAKPVTNAYRGRTPW
jgi:hypothetical protein